MPLIGVDWGGTLARAFLFGPQGDVVERRARPAHEPFSGSADFEGILAGLVGGWAPTDGVRILLCGAVGSREGWVETPYVSCPVAPAELARVLAPLETRQGQAAIVPGVSLENAERADVLRGEETQVLGALDSRWSGVAVTPGTHSKWIEVSEGSIVRFRTWMTGELFALLRDHSLLGSMMDARAHDTAAFAMGARRALDDPSITSLLFAARAEALVGRLPVGSVSAFISGALIGAEIARGLAEFGAAHIALIGQPSLTALYTQALALAERTPSLVVDGEMAAARGLWRLDQLRAEVAS